MKNEPTVVEQIIKMIDDDNRAGGIYGGLARFTNGYDTAIERVKHLLQALTTKEHHAE